MTETPGPSGLERDADIEALVKPFDSMWSEPGLHGRRHTVWELAGLAISARDERDDLIAQVRALEAERVRVVGMLRQIIRIYYEFSGEGDQALASCLSEYIDAAELALEALAEDRP